MSAEISWEVAQVIQRIDSYGQAEMTDMLKNFIQLLKDRGILEKCLRDLNSKEWMILYRAVIEVEQGL